MFINLGSFDSAGTVGASKPLGDGEKTYRVELTGVGAVSAVVEIRGTTRGTQTVVTTFNLSGSNRSLDLFSDSQDFDEYFATLVSISGQSAGVLVSAEVTGNPAQLVQFADESGVAISSSSSGLSVSPGFAPSSYSSDKSATTTVAGQSEALATGAFTVRIHNIGPTNFAKFGFGTSAADAESNVTTGGVLVPLNTTDLLRVPANATHYAWLGDTGTVTLNVIQGV